MSSHGRPKGEYTEGRQPAGFLMSSHGRPKGEYTAGRSPQIAR